MVRNAKEINYLKQWGLKNPHRVKSLIKDAISRYSLNLSGLVVFTETASRNYVVTPIIAGMAGAHVYAVTYDSPYGKVKDIEEFTYAFAEFCGVKDKIQVIFEKKEEIIRKANIVTNLGFVRPIDKHFIDMMNNKAVIPYMCEAWEYRKEDVDLDACNSRGILVMATDEEASGLEIFGFVGPLCLKMLLELEIEIYKSKIVIVSRDKFGKKIEKYLDSLGAEVYKVGDLKSESSRKFIVNSDALIVADYTSKDRFIGGKNAQISAKELSEFSQKISVVQFAGNVDIKELDKFNIPYFPQKKVGQYKMGMTLAELGPRPVIDLHCAGLKVGGVMAKARLEGKSIEGAKTMALKYSHAQDFFIDTGGSIK